MRCDSIVVVSEGGGGEIVWAGQRGQARGRGKKRWQTVEDAHEADEPAFAMTFLPVVAL